MKKMLVPVLVLAVVAISIVVFHWTDRPLKDEVPAFIPDKAVFFTMARSFASLGEALQYDVEEDSILGQFSVKEAWQLFAEGAEISDETSPAEFFRGIDPYRPLGIVSTNMELKMDDFTGSFTFFLPLSDPALKYRLVEYIMEEIDETEATVEWDGQELHLTFAGDTPMSLIVGMNKDSYLLMTYGATPEQAHEEYAALAGDQTSLSQSSSFQKKLGALRNTNDVLMYIDPSYMGAMVFEAWNLLEIEYSLLSHENFFSFLSSYKGVLSGISMTGEDFLWETVTHVDQSPAFTRDFFVAPFRNRGTQQIEDVPTLLSVLGVDIEGYVRFIARMITDEGATAAAELIQQVGDELGVDPASEILPVLGEGITFGLFGADEITLGTYNTVFTMGISDQAGMDSLLDAVFAANRHRIPEMITVRQEEIVGNSFYRINLMGIFGNIYVGTTPTEFVLTTEKSHVEDIAQPRRDGRVFKYLPYETVEEHMVRHTPVGLSYLDFHQTADLLLSLGGIVAMGDPSAAQELKSLSEQIRRFQYLYVYADERSDDMYYEKVRLSTTFGKPFLVGLVELMSDLDDMYQTW
ncbi:hypothetical protein [Chitinivibrio alkaliphilus]|uniref:DUF3352 domain-containing protein n=1 Tax=Chitinivibrio alkaliphilus ACht1 TaxID=1313304 RepID=U7DAW1_9BACT|nr:hypothetical protein [Chitinivibrio alkaliphilus]ERP38708.1 hypothetical protein CALK_0726 [Chitinivibrio alkaliphilus ACht1]